MQNNTKTKQLKLNINQPEWRSRIDWSEKDIVIAKKFNKSRELIRQIRKSHNLPSSATIPRKEPYFKVNLQNVDWKKKNTQIAKEKGVCYTTAALHRKIWAPETVKSQTSLREYLKNVDWRQKHKEIQLFLWENYGIKTCQTNISRYKRIFAPELVQHKTRMALDSVS